MEKKYAVIELPTSEAASCINIEQADMFDDYDKAMDSLNQRIEDYGGKPVKTEGKKELPISVTTAYFIYQLWIVSIPLIEMDHER